MRPPATRPPLRRMQWWEEQTKAGARPTVARCAEECEVAVRTVYRDLDFLREQLGWPLEYHRAGRFWHCTHRDFSLAAVKVTEGELVALFLAEKVLQQYRGTRYAADLHAAFAKLCAALPEEVSLDLGGLQDALSFDLGPARPVDVGVFEAVLRAARERRRLAIDYYVPERDEVTHRRVDPLHVYARGSDWYAAAFCHLRGRVQDFALSRIRAAEQTGERFQPPMGFDRDAYLAQGFGLFKGEPQEVVLRFDAYEARWVRERTWHPTQCIQEQPDGSLVLGLTVPVTEELIRWVLSYGSHCRVVDPEALRAAVRTEIERMALCQ